MNAPAGTGNHCVYPICIRGETEPLKPSEHYLGVDAASWYLNKESTFFHDFTASGTLEIAMASATEKYHAALGMFELAQGAKTAPIFDHPVLPDRNFRGGPLMIAVSLVSFRRDTVLSQILKTAASASLGIVSGLVETASKVGPQQQLAKAGETLVGGVRDLLQHQAEQRENVFGGSGIEINLQPDAIHGRTMYLLFHRGSALEPGRLSIQMTNVTSYPMYDNQALLDGAWLLLRLRRSDRYSGLRDWFDVERKLRIDVENVVHNVEDRVRPVSSGAAQLVPSTTGDTTLFDQFLELRRVIQSDGVLCEAEARERVAKLGEVFRNARAAVQAVAAPVEVVVPKGLQGPSVTRAVPKGLQDPSVTRRGEDGAMQFRGGPPVAVKMRD